MKIIGYLLATALALSFPAQLAAQENTIAFSNGVFRSKERATGDLAVLRDKVKQYFVAKGMTPGEFDRNFATLLAYNQTKCKHSEPTLTDTSCLRDLYESIVHPLIPAIVSIEDSRFWRFLSKPISSFINDNAVLDGIFTSAASVLEPVDTTRSDLAIQLEDYRNQLNAHRKVAVVAHSQGNFFANDIYAELTQAEQQSFGIVAVATPANFVAGGDLWTTFLQDFIWTVPLVPPPLRPNALNFDCGNPFTCHYFVESYLAEEDRDPRILPDIDATLARLITPSGRGPLGFVNSLTISTGTEPLILAVADFDGDQQADIAVTIYNHGVGDHLTILRNTSTIGQVRFDPLPADIPTGRGPEGVAAGDLNNDRKPDLVVANAAGLSVSVLRNFSARNFIDFQPALPPLSMPGTPHRVAIADFDKDGLPDLIVTSNSGRLVSVFHHGSDPNTIAFDYRRDFGADDFLNDLVVADIDRDTRPEILISRIDSGLLTIFQNNSIPGDVRASARSPLEAGVPPIRGIAVGDLNNDPEHALDVVIAAVGGVGVFQNSSSPGVFDLPRTDVPTGTNPDAVAIGDLDKDGHPDVVAANPDENTLTILHNRSTGTRIVLTPLAVRPATGLTPLSLALEDIDGDGWLDIVVANDDGNSVSVLLNTTGKQ